MATVIEVLNKKGEVQYFKRIESDNFSIGRSYENDLTLSDDTIDATHLMVQKNEDGTFRVIDQGTVNGTKLHKKSNASSTSLSILDVHSGDEVSIGHSRIRIVAPNQAMPIAKKIKPEHRMVVLLKHPATIVCLPVLSLLNLMYQEYITTVIEVEMTDLVMSFFQAGAVVLIVSLLLTLLAKAIRHQWLFFENLVHVCAFILLMDLGSWVLDVIFFNTGYWHSKWLLGAFTVFVIAALSGWIITFNVFTDKQILRAVIVFSFASLVLTYNLVQGYADDRDFDKMRPVVTDKFKSWVFPTYVAVTDEDFIASSKVIFEPAPETEQP